MTNQLLNSTKNMLKAFLLVIAISITGCNGKEITDANSNSNDGSETSIDIHGAALTGDINQVNKYIEAGGDLNVKDNFGSTPLAIAILFDKTNVAVALIEAGADLQTQGADGSTPLHTAAFFCRTEVVKLLLEKGADKTVVNNYGSTPYASVAGPFEQVKPFYMQIAKDLGPLGLKLDYDRLQKTRPQIAELLK
jgi:ankyrin repeat protein